MVRLPEVTRNALELAPDMLATLILGRQAVQGPRQNSSHGYNTAQC